MGIARSFRRSPLFAHIWVHLFRGIRWYISSAPHLPTFGVFEYYCWVVIPQRHLCPLMGSFCGLRCYFLYNHFFAFVGPSRQRHYRFAGFFPSSLHHQAVLFASLPHHFPPPQLSSRPPVSRAPHDAGVLPSPLSVALRWQALLLSFRPFYFIFSVHFCNLNFFLCV